MAFRFCSGLLVAVLAAWQVSASPTVNVRMQAAFTSGPYLLELLLVKSPVLLSKYSALL